VAVHGFQQIGPSGCRRQIELLVQREEFREDLRRDTRTFFESKDVYDGLGVVWKRGILLLGPPGNGKTESIKALLKETAYPALYVKSFTTPFVSRWPPSSFVYALRTDVTALW